VLLEFRGDRLPASQALGQSRLDRAVIDTDTQGSTVSGIRGTHHTLRSLQTNEEQGRMLEKLKPGRREMTPARNPNKESHSQLIF